jgi:hypothetical protein
VDNLEDALVDWILLNKNGVWTVQCRRHRNVDDFGHPSETPGYPHFDDVDSSALLTGCAQPPVNPARSLLRKRSFAQNTGKLANIR